MKLASLSAAAALLAACIAASAVTPAFAAGEPPMEADHERGPVATGPAGRVRTCRSAACPCTA
jgi:hypothetical protein